jgi:hypothetical protein
VRRFVAEGHATRSLACCSRHKSAGRPELDWSGTQVATAVAESSRKLNVNGQSQALLLAREQGWV